MAKNPQTFASAHAVCLPSETLICFNTSPANN